VTESINLRAQLKERTQYLDIVGSSRTMQEIFETIENIAETDANVLVVGESGTGKELIANAIHYNSTRAKKPFIKVNCAALPSRIDRIGVVWTHKRRVYRSAGVTAGP